MTPEKQYKYELEAINKAFKESGITYYRLAKQADISDRCAKDVIKGNTNIKLITYLKVKKALGI